MAGSLGRIEREGSHQELALRHVCRECVGLLRRREQDLRWLVTNPFWLASPLEPLFSALNFSAPSVAYLIAACLTDQKVTQTLAQTLTLRLTGSQRASPTRG